MNSKSDYVLALDLGTTGNRAMLFDAGGTILGGAYKELTQYYPQPGWVEHDPQEIWLDTRSCMDRVLRDTGITANQIVAIGLSVQRETCLLWDKTTGKPLHNAIVWQDRRTSSICQNLKEQGHAAKIQDLTGLVVDAYFSATKLASMLETLERSGSKVNLDNVLAGTVDTWVLWKLTGGKVHATDHSNASRTMLMNLASLSWEPALLDLFGIPANLMPEIKPSMGLFGKTNPELLGVAIPITAVFGDQQAALFAHGCNQPGMLKCTYGTGCFLISQSGNQLIRSHNQLLSTVAWTVATNRSATEVNYAQEGAMFTTGASIQWLRDGLKLITTSAQTEQLARQVSDTNGVYFVPALCGLGTPHWDMKARGAFFGITGGVQREHMIRAVLESIAYQVKEVVEAMNHDSDTPIKHLKVDGGVARNDFLMQFQADVLGIEIERPSIVEATVQGAAFAAGLASGFWDDYDNLVKQNKIDRIFEPGGEAQKVNANFSMWLKAVERAKNWID